MQTLEENINDLIEALKISSAYRQQREQQLKQQGIRDYFPMFHDDEQKIVNMH